MKELSIERLENFKGGIKNTDLASGAMCIAGTLAVPISIASGLLTGGVSFAGVFWGMTTATISCSIFAASVK